MRAVLQGCARELVIGKLLPAVAPRCWATGVAAPSAQAPAVSLIAVVLNNASSPASGSVAVRTARPLARATDLARGEPVPVAVGSGRVTVDLTVDGADARVLRLTAR